MWSYDLGIWGTEQLHLFVQHEIFSQVFSTMFFIQFHKKNVWSICHLIVNIVTGTNLWCYWWYREQISYGYSLYYVREFLNNRIPQRWVGRIIPNNSVMHHWPSRSPDLTACDCLLCGFYDNLRGVSSSNNTGWTPRSHNILGVKKKNILVAVEIVIFGYFLLKRY